MLSLGLAVVVIEDDLADVVVVIVTEVGSDDVSEVIEEYEFSSHPVNNKTNAISEIHVFFILI